MFASIRSCSALAFFVDEVGFFGTCMVAQGLNFREMDSILGVPFFCA